MLIRWRDSGFPTLSGVFDDPFFKTDLTSFFGRDLSDIFERNPDLAMPAVNIKETDNNFQIEVAAPGLRKEDFSIQLDEHVLTLSAQRETSSGYEPAQQQGGGQAGAPEGQAGGAEGQGSSQKTGESKKGKAQSTAVQTATQNMPERYTRREFSYTSFQRSFTLPESVDPEKISANYQDGILLITLPKRQQAQVTRAKTINIS